VTHLKFDRKMSGRISKNTDHPLKLNRSASGPSLSKVKRSATKVLKQ
jgi:hypothetical protein